MPMLHRAGVAYLVSIGNFYYQSGGFTKFFNELYAYWKCIPLLILISFVAVHGGGVPVKRRAFLAIALTAGCMGDYLIGMSNEGIVTGALAFGVGHIFYMLLFVYETRTVMRELAMVLGLWSAFVGTVCLLPLLKVSVAAVLIMAVYSVLLTATLLLSASQYMHGTDAHPAQSAPHFWRLLGFALFYVSDNVLIFNHCGWPLPHAELIILSTYYAAQYFLVRAEISYEQFRKINSNGKAKSN